MARPGVRSRRNDVPTAIACWVSDEDGTDRRRLSVPAHFEGDRLRCTHVSGSTCIELESAWRAPPRRRFWRDNRSVAGP